MRIVLLGASFTTSNMGVSALAASSLLSAFYGFPKAELAMLDYWKVTRQFTVRSQLCGDHDVPLLHLRFSKNPFDSAHVARLLVAAILWRILPIRAWRSYLENSHPRLRTLVQADVIAAISGGDSFSDIYGARRLIYMAFPQWIVLALGKPLVRFYVVQGASFRGTKRV
jgi:colanic acid/amylovoran biosynthesis protein